MLKKCPDCGGELESGAMIDNTHGGFLPLRYGKIALSTHVPSRLLMYAGENMEFLDVRRVHAYRCQSCNRIFQYAQDRVISENLKRDLNNQTAIVLFVVFSVMIVLLIVSLAAVAYTP